MGDWIQALRIATVEVENFRCLKHVEIDFDAVTTLIGPNGSGKSTVLRALDWFFDGEKGHSTDDDVYAGAAGSGRVRVRVTFDALTSSDRQVLGEKYAPITASNFTAWRTWESGMEKITGKALAFLPFEAVRAAQGAIAKKEALAQVRKAHPDKSIPNWTTIAATETALDEWERAHPDGLSEAEVSDTHFFGFSGRGKLSGLFDYVFVAADLRASEESADAKGTILGKILERTLDTTTATGELVDLIADFSQKQAEVNERHLGDQLRELGRELSAEVSSFTLGRQVQLEPVPIEVKPQTPKVGVSILDDAVRTNVGRQGHGFQRALLVAALKLLAAHGVKDGGESVTCLAIEEPELYQHPTQARAFASVLRTLVEDQAGAIQVVYATHSPYFVEPRYFDQIRRVTRRDSTTGFPMVHVNSASLAKVCLRLAGFEAERAIRSRWEQVCLKNLSEAFFADGVILVEGDDEKAILEGVSSPLNALAVAGVAVAAANGKTKLLVPQAILDELGINTMIIFDNDSGLGNRMRAQGKEELDIGAAELSTQDQNRKILRYFDLDEENYPKGVLSRRVVALDDTLEAMIERDWPEWEATRQQLVASGRGVAGKNAATYALAAKECSHGPQGELATLFGAVASV